MDFIPGGKALKSFKGASAKLGLAKIKKQLVQQVTKKAAEKVAAQLSKKAIRLAKRFKININTKVAQQLLTHLDTSTEQLKNCSQKTDLQSND